MERGTNRSEGLVSTDVAFGETADCLYEYLILRLKQKENIGLRREGTSSHLTRVRKVNCQMRLHRKIDICAGFRHREVEREESERTRWLHHNEE